MANKSTVWFTANAGALVRGRIKRAVKQYAWDNDYPLSVEEDKGLLTSLFRFELTVPSKDYAKVKREIWEWVAGLVEVRG